MILTNVISTMTGSLIRYNKPKEIHSRTTDTPVPQSAHAFKAELLRSLDMELVLLIVVLSIQPKT